MKDTALYEHLLGLKTPWSVKSVDLSLADQRVVVEVILKRGQVWADPTDSTKRAHINGWTERQWRHLDTCQFETIIKARVPQVKYSDGTVEELAVPWAERYSRVTLLMEAFVVKLLQACPTTQGVCELTQLAWSTVNGIMVNAVERGMLRRSEDDVPHLGLDEKSSECGHTYVSILTTSTVPECLIWYRSESWQQPRVCWKHSVRLNALRLKRWRWICGLLL